MPASFYTDPKYKKRQAEVTRKNWKLGYFSSIVKPLDIRVCLNSKCAKEFLIKSYLHNTYCSKKCAAIVNNTGREKSPETKKKISLALTDFQSPLKGIGKVPKIKIKCMGCKKEFKVLPYLAKIRKYCSIDCSMRSIGRMTTSPKAAKGKSGIRLDISQTICFYSTWEANIARVFNLVTIRWEYAPQIFDLGQHTYRPDFYLPEIDTFIEVKNFMNFYSLRRDRLFRKKYPQLKLEVISKEIYKEIEFHYKSFIDNWEA